MSDLNKEALDIWGGMKPMIDQEISSRTQGMVQRRKAKVTTAPSLATNTIGVAEAFGQEIFLPFVSNMISAKVGDFVWIEWMYGATNAFVSSFAAVDDKDITVAGDLTVGGDATFNGVVDVVPRRCLATLSSEGWYRIMTFNGASANDANGYAGSQIDFTIGRDNGANRPENHNIRFHLIAGVIKFDSEQSTSNVMGIDKIRYCRNGSNGYVDIHYLYSTQNNVFVNFTVCDHYSRQYRYVATNFTHADTSPVSPETVVTEYTFAANTDGFVTSSFSTSKGSVYAYRSGDMVTVTFVGNSTTWTEDEVFMTIADGIRPATFIDVVSYIGRQAVVVRIYQNGNIVLWIGSTLTGNQRLYFSATYPIQH